MGKRSKGQKSRPETLKKIAKKSGKAFSSKKSSGIDKISKASTNPNRAIKEGSEGFYRSKATIKRLNMYREKPNKNRFVRPEKSVKIEGNRKLFGNTRTITQKSLEDLRKEMEKQSHDTYSVFLSKTKLPQSLINPLKSSNNINQQHSTFDDTFGKNARRTKPTLKVYTMEELAENTKKLNEDYNMANDSNLKYLYEEDKDAPEMKFMKAGQSKRIYGELLKVIDASDVILEILDSRDPAGTKCEYVENFIEKNCPHKHIVYILNKCDLVPTWVTAAWIKHLSKKYPTIAFHASVTNPYGKPALFNLLRQFDALHKDKKNISVGFVGYPNVGKSSVINALKKQNCCRSAPIPGETKIWQYVTLTKRIYLIDCPGIVYEVGQTQMDRVLKGVVRAEKIEEPMEFIDGILEKANQKHLKNIYKIDKWESAEDFVGQCAKNYGKLLKGGDPDLKAMAKLILMDWQRAKIPYFAEPPKNEAEIKKENKMEVEGNKEEEESKDKNKEYGINQVIDEIEVTKQEYDNKKEENEENEE
ncbi:MAG: 50S ribosome-binding GTPase [archaeon]|nr:50S ribosome-binding GTPase [archaeon]